MEKSQIIKSILGFLAFFTGLGWFHYNCEKNEISMLFFSNALVLTIIIKCARLQRDSLLMEY